MENTNVTEQSTNEIMPMAASGETNFASLTEKTTPASGDMFLMEDSEDTKKINYDKLADAILNKLTSKTYSGLETTAKNFVTAINELNSKSLVEYDVESSTDNRTLTIKIPNLGELDICNVFIYAIVGDKCYLSVQINHGTSYSSSVVSARGANIEPSSYTWDGGEKVFTVQMTGDYKNVHTSKCYAIK